MKIPKVSGRSCAIISDTIRVKLNKKIITYSDDDWQDTQTALKVDENSIFSEISLYDQNPDGLRQCIDDQTSGSYLPPLDTLPVMISHQQPPVSQSFYDHIEQSKLQDFCTLPTMVSNRDNTLSYYKSMELDHEYYDILNLDYANVTSATESTFKINPKNLTQCNELDTFEMTDLKISYDASSTCLAYNLNYSELQTVPDSVNYIPDATTSTLYDCDSLNAIPSTQSAPHILNEIQIPPYSNDPCRLIHHHPVKINSNGNSGCPVENPSIEAQNFHNSCPQQLSSLKFSCNICNKIFKNKKSKREHDKKFHGLFLLRYSCGFCDLISDSTNAHNIINHHKLKHNDFPLPNVKEIPCKKIPNTEQGNRLY